MKRIQTIAALQYIGKEVKLSGWAETIRSHGGIIFVDLRDFSGKIQVVFNPEIKGVKEIRPEWVIEIKGKVKERPKAMINPKIPTGKIEVEAKELKVLSQAKTLPFAIDRAGYEISEEKRLKYRYLDLRRERLKKNIIKRHKVVQFMREYLEKQGFIEIETPIITKSTPEGARDFVVPSRLQPGKFYALPQAPQQFKQLLQVAGFEKYFQIARCFRDEDPRADRQAEHTQLDLEMSFVEREEIMNLIEDLFIALIKELYPQKKIQEIPFPRLTYKEAMEKYGTDRPDLRQSKDDPELLAFCWITDFPFFEKKEDGQWTFTHNPFSAPQPEFVDDLLAQRNIEKIITTQYDLVLNGWELGGGSIRSHQPEVLKAVFKIIGYKEKEIEKNFGHLLEAFEYGAPPHGGIAQGIDRLMAILEGEPNIREVIAFPKTGDNRDLMMGAPSEITAQQLKELGLKLVKRKKKDERKNKGS